METNKERQRERESEREGKSKWMSEWNVTTTMKKDTLRALDREWEKLTKNCLDFFYYLTYERGMIRIK